MKWLILYKFLAFYAILTATSSVSLVGNGVEFGRWSRFVVVIIIVVVIVSRSVFIDSHCRRVETRDSNVFPLSFGDNGQTTSRQSPNCRQHNWLHASSSFRASSSTSFVSSRTNCKSVQPATRMQQNHWTVALGTINCYSRRAQQTVLNSFNCT